MLYPICNAFLYFGEKKILLEKLDKKNRFVYEIETN